MPEFLKSALSDGAQVAPLDLTLRLLASLLMGFVVAWIYLRTRKAKDITPSFPGTLVLLAVLIAMVTQVIGDNIARAFSLVGALSIVRFRTVVRDTQDTAFVIFAVVVGMAIGADNLWVAVIGMAVVGLAACLMMRRPKVLSTEAPDLMLSLRVATGQDVEKAVGGLLDAHLEALHLVSMGTAKQGMSFDVTYHARLRPEGSVDKIVKALNRIEGIQSIQVQRRDVETE